MKKSRKELYIFIIQIVVATSGLFFGFMESSFFPFSVFLYPLVIYHISVREQNRKKLLYKICILSTICCAINLYWVSYPLTEIGRLPILSTYAVVIAIAFVLSLFSMLFAYMVWYSKQVFSFTIPRLIFIGLIWTICEYLQSFVFSGFPWLTLMPALVQWLPVVSPISIAGSYLTSGFLVMLFCSLYESIASRSVLLGLFFSLLFLFYSILSYLLYSSEHKEGLPLNIALIQGNIEQTNKWDKDMEEIILNKYITLTKEAIAHSNIKNNNFDLIIWPETALPFFLSPKTPLTRKLSSFIDEIHVPLLTGNIRYGGNAENKKRLIFNSALLFADSHMLRTWYDKEKLVPFGEYTPFFLDSFIDILNVQRGGEFTSGENNVLLSVKNIPFGMLICYEIIFPSYTQKQVQEGANFLVTISNDAWFGYSRAAWQHLQHARLRAIEHSRFLLRCTNTGISAVISPKGKVLQSTELFTDSYITATIETQEYYTIYTIIAPYILPFSILASFLLFILRAPTFSIRSKKQLIRREI